MIRGMNTAQTATIGVRELHRNMKRISERVSHGGSFVVMKSSRPVFRIEPIERKRERKYTWEDLEKFQFTGFEKDLSKKVDKILYGV